MGEPSQSEILIQLGVESITNNRPDRLKQILAKFPLEQLSGNESSSILGRYLRISAEYQRGLCVDEILTAWNRVIPIKQTNLSVKLWIFIDLEVNTSTLRFIVTSRPGFTFDETIRELIQYDGSQIAEQSAERAYVAYGEQTQQTYSELLSVARREGNIPMMDFLIRRIKEVSGFAPVPKWVGNFIDGPVPRASELEIPDAPPPRFTLPPTEEAVDILTNGLEYMGLSIDEQERARDVLRERLSLSTEKEKLDLLYPFLQKRALEELQSDREIFRILGPANPLLNARLDEMEYGGCRMFTCDVFDYNEETGFIEDWFDGTCEECYQKIRVRWHAVRRPRPNGGWRGSYCSMDCLRNAQRRLEFYGNQPEMATWVMIDDLEKDLNEIGIQDRTIDD